MSALAQAAKIIALVAGVAVSGYAEGDGAFYHKVSMRQVCELRDANGWTTAWLDCSHPCLAAWGLYDPSKLGTDVLAYLPGGGWRI